MLRQVGRCVYVVGLTTALSCWFPAPVFGQSTAPLTAEPGSTVTVTLELELETSVGPLSGSDTDTAAATGTGLVTVFPTAPPFEHLLVHSLTAEVGTLDFHYSFFFGLVIVDVTLSDLVLVTPEPFAGPLDAGGEAFFPAAPVSATASAHVVAPFFGVDEIQPLDVTTNGQLGLRITEAGGIVVMDRLAVPPFSAEADPATLPPGVTAQVVTAITDASDLVYRGRHDPSVPGDGNGDGVVDLADYPGFAACHLGPNVPVEVVCTLFDFDADQDVDLLDFADFQWASAGP